MFKCWFQMERDSRMLLFLILVALVHHTTSDSDWTRQCNECSCIWVSGRRTANCSNKGFNQIPKDISNVVRDIDFSNNPLYNLEEGELFGAHLVDIHKLKFQNCLLESISEFALKKLALLIELDLSHNQIHELKQNTFKDNIKIRIIILSYNHLQELGEGLFSNLSYVQRIHVDHNELEHIYENTFSNLPALTDINMAYNKLKTIDFDLKLKLVKLNSINIEENPWKCDCYLEPFHQSLVRNNLITHSTKCVEPPNLKGKLWTVNQIFPCSPEIIQPLPLTMITATSSNVTLTCQVFADPEPNIIWMNNGHNVENKLKFKYFTSKSKLGKYYWNNLTITNLSFKDKGDYWCVAKNLGGAQERNISLLINNDTSAVGIKNMSGLVIGLSVGLLVLVFLIVILVFLFCKRNLLKRNSVSENIDMKSNIEIRKGMNINPISKPPRAAVVASVLSDDTEISEAKRNLLDNGSIFDCDDESRYFDYNQPLLAKSRHVVLDSGDEKDNVPYPPDLLAFSRRMQISPAGSNTSTIGIDSKYPNPHIQQSPLYSPVYDQLSLYKTLPYSRSHSPFAHGGGFPRIPKQGYVTIPRKPRQSWSSEPPPLIEAIGEPLYDNLGVRSTAGGHSKLSLTEPGSNRISSAAISPIIESPKGNENVSTKPEVQNRPMKSVVSKSTPNSTPIKPMESSTLPRNFMTKKAPLRIHSATDNTEGLQNPPEDYSSFVSDISLNEGKSKKIPPRPPPKPTKIRSSKPLIEDEGEDGTEV